MKAFAKEVRGGPKCPTDANNAVAIMKVIDEVYTKAGLPKRGLKL